MFDELRIGNALVQVVWVLSWPTTPIPRVWETMRVYGDQNEALEAQTALSEWASDTHGIELQSTVQAAPVSLSLGSFHGGMERAYSYRVLYRGAEAPYDNFSY